MSARPPAPIVLAGRLVALEPLDLARHMDGLAAEPRQVVARLGLGEPG